MDNGDVSLVMGIDLGGRKVACSVLDGTHLVAVGAYVADPNTPRCWQLKSIAEHVFAIAVESQADYIFIEDPLVGRNVKSSMMLAETKGAVLARLADLHTIRVVQIEMANVRSWKLRVVGNGNASKEDVKLHLSEANGAYPAMCGSDQDKYDAVAIGLYGDSVVRASADLKLDDS